MRDADGDAASIGQHVANAVRDGDADRVRAEVVIIDPTWGEIPSRARVLEVAHQFALLGVDADGEAWRVLAAAIVERVLSRAR